MNVSIFVIFIIIGDNDEDRSSTEQLKCAGIELLVRRFTSSSCMRRIDLAQGIELLVGRFTGKYERDTISAFVIQTLILISTAAS